MVAHAYPGPRDNMSTYSGFELVYTKDSPWDSQHTRLRDAVGGFQVQVLQAGECNQRLHARVCDGTAVVLPDPDVEGVPKSRCCRRVSTVSDCTPLSVRLSQDSSCKYTNPGSHEAILFTTWSVTLGVAMPSLAEPRPHRPTRRCQMEETLASWTPRPRCGDTPLQDRHQDRGGEVVQSPFARVCTGLAHDSPFDTASFWVPRRHTLHLRGGKWSSFICIYNMCVYIFIDVSSLDIYLIYLSLYNSKSKYQESRIDKVLCIYRVQPVERVTE